MAIVALFLKKAPTENVQEICHGLKCTTSILRTDNEGLLVSQEQCLEYGFKHHGFRFPTYEEDNI